MSSFSEPTHTGRGRFIANARSIGGRLVQSAVWRGDACTWVIGQGDAPVSEGATELANGSLYNGTAGIGLFLAELHRAAPFPEAAATAMGALRHAENEAATLPGHAFGLLSGRVGIAYAILKSASCLGEDLTGPAESILRPLVGRAADDRYFDVVGGGGGAIPALVAMSSRLPASVTLDVAHALGNNLIATADKRPFGWSWGGSPLTVHNLCGFSHGASGIGHALLELFVATSEDRFRHAAEEAFLYERQFLDPVRGNWPDFRHKDLAEHFAAGRIEQLRDRLRGGEALPWEPRYPAFWCHGAPGIALARLRAHEVLGHPLYLEEAHLALRTTAESLQKPEANWSLCHGSSGSGDVLLTASRRFGVPEFEPEVAAAALSAIEQYEEEGRAWPSGTMTAGPDPTLFVGDAGVGLFLLRLTEPKVDSVLLITGRPTKSPSPASPGGGGALSRAAERYFPGVLHLLGTLEVDWRRELPDEPAVPTASDGDVVRKAIRRAIDKEAREEVRSLLLDRFGAEAAGLALLSAVPSFADDYLGSLARTPPDDVDWGAATPSLSPRARVVRTTTVWDGRARDDRTPLIRREARSYLVYLVGGSVRVHDLSGATAEALSFADGTRTLAEIASLLRTRLGDGAESEMGSSFDAVRAELARMYQAGLLVTSIEPH